jgi:hypothetical protein
MTTQPRAGKDPKPASDTPAETAGATSIRLKDPITFGEDCLERIDMRPLTAGDLWDLPLEGLQMGHMLQIACRVSNTPPPVMKRASARDMARIVKVVNGQLAPLQDEATE